MSRAIPMRNPRAPAQRGQPQPYDTSVANRYDRAMFKDSLTALIVCAALAGCAREETKPNLPVACALADCTCVSDGVASFFERDFDDKVKTTTDVLWTDRGNAYCPEGFSLHLVTEEEKEKKKNQYYTPP